MSILELLQQFAEDKINYVQLKDLLRSHRKDDLLAFILRANQKGAFYPFFKQLNDERL